jgi:N-acetylglutamate synthase/N-acetylornithine aminotransferase
MSASELPFQPEGFWSSVAVVPTDVGNLNLTVVGADESAQVYGAFTRSDSASAAVKWSRTQLVASGGVSH